MQGSFEVSKAYLTFCAAIAATVAPASAAGAAPAKPAQAPTRAAVTGNIAASFKAADTNGDGVLSVQEVSATEAKVLKQRVEMARQRLAAEFTKLDTNKDGQLSKVEFMAAAPSAPTSAPDGAKLLAELDKNKDGKVSLEEYGAPLLSRFDAVDTNHDGTISAAEAAAARAKR
jgi:Ca2+-binding EF-hand superfamily protein